MRLCECFRSSYATSCCLIPQQRECSGISRAAGGNLAPLKIPFTEFSSTVAIHVMEDVLHQQEAVVINLPAGLLTLISTPQTLIASVPCRQPLKDVLSLDIWGTGDAENLAP